MNHNERQDFFKANREKLTIQQMADVLQVGIPTIRNYERKFGKCAEESVTEVEPKTLVLAERKARKLAESAKEDKKKLDYLEEETERLQDALDLAIELGGHERVCHIPTPRHSKKTESTMVALVSDWHIGMTVDPNVVPRNTFNLDIARHRATLYFQRLVKMLDLEQHEVVVNEVVLALLGDFIDGALRVDSMETAGTQPAQQTVIAFDLLVAGIEYILDNTHVTLTIPCIVGNHSRTTEKTRTTTEVGHSFEYILYHFLAEHFKGNPRVQFTIPQSIHLYPKVYGEVLRLMHGHHGLRGGGGVGGLAIPLLRAIGKWDRTQRADLTVLAHFHHVLDVGIGVVNGSLCGYDSYAMSMGFPFEKPNQVYFMLNSKFGRSGYRKIHLED